MKMKLKLVLRRLPIPMTPTASLAPAAPPHRQAQRHYQRVAAEKKAMVLPISWCLSWWASQQQNTKLSLPADGSLPYFEDLTSTDAMSVGGHLLSSSELLVVASIATAAKKNGKKRK
jgi:hypothetical protein